MWGGTITLRTRPKQRAFQSTHPVWGGTRSDKRFLHGVAISIHPPRVGWDCLSCSTASRSSISIHPPRVGWDKTENVLHGTGQISIHPPRVGWDPKLLLPSKPDRLFQSTHPVWGGTAHSSRPPATARFQSTHPVWGGTLSLSLAVSNRIFQSTHPVWGGTFTVSQPTPPKVISIHPPRVGWDQNQKCPAQDWSNFNPPTPCGVGRHHGDLRPQRGHFNPPTPCGVGHLAPVKPCRLSAFQSTHPVWGGTTASLSSEERVPISIHPPRVGWDLVILVLFLPLLAFQSTHPVWGGTFGTGKTLSAVRISIHPPRVGWDRPGSLIDRLYSISIHPPRVGWDANKRSIKITLENFNPPTPCGVGRYLLIRFTYIVQISIHPPRVGWDIRGPSARKRQSNFNPPTPCGVGQQKFTKQAAELLRK